MTLDKELKRLAESTKAKLAGLDFSEEENELAKLKSKAAEHKDAIAKLDAELQELGRQISANRESDGEQLADAILAGEDAATAEAVAPSIETLRSRRDALAKARVAIITRKDEVGRNEQELRNGVRLRISEVITPLVSLIAHRQKQAAQDLVDAHAALETINFLTNGFVHERYVSRRSIEDGLTGQDRLLEGRRFLDVPDWLRDTLASVEETQPLHGGVILKQVRRW